MGRAAGVRCTPPSGSSSRSLRIALIGANVPFAPPYLPDPPDERDSSHYIAALAELMRRSRRRPPDATSCLANVLHVTLSVVEGQRRKEHA